MISTYKYFDTDTMYSISGIYDIFIIQVNKLPYTEFQTTMYNILSLCNIPTEISIHEIKIFGRATIFNKTQSRISFLSEIFGEKNSFTLCINKKQFKTKKRFKLI